MGYRKSGAMTFSRRLRSIDFDVIGARGQPERLGGVAGDPHIDRPPTPARARSPGSPAQPSQRWLDTPPACVNPAIAAAITAAPYQPGLGPAPKPAPTFSTGSSQPSSIARRHRLRRSQRNSVVNDGRRAAAPSSRAWSSVERPCANSPSATWHLAAADQALTARRRCDPRVPIALRPPCSCADPSDTHQ